MRTAAFPLLGLLLPTAAGAAILREAPRRAPDLRSPESVLRLAGEMASRDWRFDARVGRELLDQLEDPPNQANPEAYRAALLQGMRQWLIAAAANGAPANEGAASVASHLATELSDCSKLPPGDLGFELLGALEVALSRPDFLSIPYRRDIERALATILVNADAGNERLQPAVLEMIARRPRVGATLARAVDEVAEDSERPPLIRLHAARAQFMILAYAPVSP